MVRLVELVTSENGEALTFVASEADETTTERIRRLYDDARQAEWAEFASECDKCLAELQREITNQKFTLAELDEEEQNVERLRRWHREIRSRDTFEATPVELTQRQLDICIDELDRFTALVYRAVGLTQD